jgi:DNA mismatch repair protein MutS
VTGVQTCALPIWIKSLKVRFNAVFGYFIEITTANLGSVPPDYTRKQTTAGGERFITPELKEMEGKILGAEERARALEIEIFERLRGMVLEHVMPLQETAAAAGAIDALGSLAETARLFGYSRPMVDDSTVLEIRDGRHPVLEQRTGGETFVPNDTDLDAASHRMGIITGPNMAGKSTYLRQVGLLTVMAQIGSWIPAASARIGAADRIFTRVGASDDLSRGHSTFMVEMNETANILHNATSHSLVLLDEIGRGTATFDGLSIAWSVAEHLHDVTGCRTFFATHYHELPDLARTRTGVRNFNVAVREQNDRIVFLRKIIEGAADRSYGIQVARLAGLPGSVVERAKEILTNLEKAELNAEGRPALARTRRKSPAVNDSSLEPDLFG